MAKRFQRVGVRQPETLVEKRSIASPIFRAQPKFQGTSSFQATVTAPTASKAEGRKLAIPEISQGWGGKVVFAQPSPTDVISTVVRTYPEVVRSWGGLAIVPLYWLDDFAPIYPEPIGHNKWLIRCLRTRWLTTVPFQRRFRVSVALAGGTQ